MSFAVHDDPWLGEIMRRPVFRVDGSGDASELARHAIAQGHSFYFCKVPTDKVADVQTLSRLGFSVVDTNVTFELTREIELTDIEARLGEGRSVCMVNGELRVGDLDVSDIRSGEEEAVLEIAGSAFRYSRFHLDPQIGLPLAHLIKREWIRNYALRKRGDLMLVARDKGRIVGFLAPLTSHGTAVIDLVAVATDAHGKGAGSVLTAGFANRYRGMPRIVGTQVANVPSIRLYNKLGFQLQRSSYVLHLHK